MPRSNDPDPSRRRVLRALPIAVAALSGCNQRDDGTATVDDPRPTATPTRTEREPPSATETQTATTSSVPTDLPARLAERAHPLDIVDPTADPSDLDALGASFAEATVVGLGEATHGTREFFGMKHRLLRYMVAEQGLRTIAWEANFPETFMVDAYVTGGDVDPRAALENVYFWTWNTDSVLAMLRWLREFNADRDPGDQVRFYGFDVQLAQGAARRLRSYFERVDPDYLATVESDLAAVEGGLYDGRERRVDDDAVEAAARLVEDVAARLERERSAYVAASSESSWELASRHRWVMERALTLAESRRDESRDDYSQIRDAAMAEMVAWVREFAAGDRVALWGHNLHVADRYNEPLDLRRMGDHLRERYREDYYAVGFEFGHGRVRARATNRDMRVFEIDPPPAETLSAAVGGVPHDRYALVLREVEDASLRAALSARLGIHMIGSTYDPEWALRFPFPRVDLTTEYDALVFVQERTETTIRDDEFVTATPTATPEP